MKILQINVVVNSGSTGRIAEGIGNIVLSNDSESYIAYGRMANKSDSQLIRIGNDFGVKLHGMLTRVFDNHSLGLSSKKATNEFIKEIEEINPDIIHFHNLHGYYINIKVLFNYLSQKNIPIVWTLHDCWSFTGHCAHFDYVGCYKWKIQCYSCPQKKSYPSSLLIDNSKKNYTKKKELFNSIKNMTIVPVSYWLGDLVKDSFLNRFPIKVIQNGIDINAFNIKEFDDIQSKYNLKDRFIILGVASTWDVRKGLSDFIKLSQQLKEDEIIVLVGLSKEQIELLPKNIIGIQRTESIDELAKLYSMADVFINPTYEDTFPTTNLESLACGTPIVTYKTGGSVESVDETVGWIVEQGDIDSILKIISNLKSEPISIKEERKINCREKAERLYNKDIKFQEYFDLYNKLLEKNNNENINNNCNI